MLKRNALISLILSLNILSAASEAGTTLIFNKNTPNTVAVNFDWKYREGTVVVHPREQLMISSVNNYIHHPLIWKSTYANVIFHAGNRFQPGIALNGINEKGLIASALILKTSAYPYNSELPTLNTSEWVQYVLDKFKTVQEVIDDSAEYQLLPSTYRGVALNFQLVINDAEGKSAVLEYLNGKLIVRNQDQLTHLAVTNTEYDTALTLLNDYKEFGGTMALPGGYDSNSRFVRAAHYIKRLPSFVAKEEHIAYAFNGLSDVAQAPATATPTQLSIVFDSASKTVYFRSINESALRVIRLADFNFEELSETLTLNTYQHFSGNVVEQFRSPNY